MSWTSLLEHRSHCKRIERPFPSLIATTLSNGNEKCFVLLDEGEISILWPGQLVIKPNDGIDR